MVRVARNHPRPLHFLSTVRAREVSEHSIDSKDSAATKKMKHIHHHYRNVV